MHPAVKAYIQARLKGANLQNATASALIKHDAQQFQVLLDTPEDGKWLETKLARLVELGLPEDCQ